MIIKFKAIKKCTIREFAQFCGVLVSICPAIPYSWVYMKKFEREKFLALRANQNNYDAYMGVSQKLQADFQWWQDSLKLPFCKLNSFNFILEIFSDASLSGWGAVCGEKRTRGFLEFRRQTNGYKFFGIICSFYGASVFCYKFERL